MSEVLFNFHDVVLLMTAMQCCFYVVLLIATNTAKSRSNYFLAAFLLAHAFIPLNELILWGQVFNWKVRTTLPSAFFIPGFAYYIDAVLLYFCVKSLVFQDFQLRKRDALHFLPLLAYLVFLYVEFYAVPLQQRIEMIRSGSFVYGKPFITVDFLCKSLRLIYCGLCLFLLVKYRDILKKTHSNIERINITWLIVLVVGFLIVMLIEYTLSVSKLIWVFVQYEMGAFQNLGLSGYYLVFILVNLLVFSSIRYFPSIETVKLKQSERIAEKVLVPKYIQRVEKLMHKEKPYLVADLTLEMLANQLDLSIKELSTIINRHYNNNFYEFVNNYRIDETKRLLADPKSQEKSITEIYESVGFKTKSVFNAYFKKAVGMTPSQYRMDCGKS